MPEWEYVVPVVMLAAIASVWFLMGPSKQEKTYFGESVRARYVTADSEIDTMEVASSPDNLILFRTYGVDGTFAGLFLFPKATEEVALQRGDVLTALIVADNNVYMIWTDIVDNPALLSSSFKEFSEGKWALAPIVEGKHQLMLVPTTSNPPPKNGGEYNNPSFLFLLQGVQGYRKRS